MAVRVLVGEDSYLAREGIAHVLEQIPDVEVVGMYGDTDELRRAIDANPPDVVLTDVRMPPTGTDEGLRLASELRRTHPQVGVLVLSQYAEPIYVTAIFEDGAERRGFMQKDRLRSREDLARALHDVATGGSYVDASVVVPLIARGPRPVLEMLTPREREILGLIALGQSNIAIAATAGITKRGVERHVNAIFAKLSLPPDDDVNRRVKAVLMYLSESHVPDVSG
jgi:DNA-binding NarL/FixJ family response regulator